MLTPKFDLFGYSGFHDSVSCDSSTLWNHGCLLLYIKSGYSRGKYSFLPACGIPAAPILAAVAVMEIMMICPIDGFIPIIKNNWTYKKNKNDNIH